MLRTYAKTTVRGDGKARTSTVSVDPGAGKVLVVSSDEASDRSHLDRRSTSDPARLARELADDLISDGYRRIR